MTAEPRHTRVDWLSTLLLALAAVATAWSTYQSAQWRGEQAANTGKSTAARIQSAAASTRAGQQTQIDIATFVQWANATQGGDAGLARFYRDRFRPEFRPAFDAWIATDPLHDERAPETPFALPEYRLAERTKSTALDLSATGYANAAAAANHRADEYMLGVVLFATSLFFAGISTKIAAGRQRIVVLTLGYVILLGTLVWLATLPVQLTT